MRHPLKGRLRVQGHYLRDVWKICRRRLHEDRLPVLAGHLAYVTLLSLVPLVTVIFSIFSFFPIFAPARLQIEEFVFSNFVPAASDLIHHHINRFVANASRMTSIGVAALVLVGALWLPVASPARAAGIDWWQRGDQATHARLEEGAKAYRQGDYPAAEKAFAGIDTAEGQYNLGNALAKQQRYDDAVAAYDRALRLQPGMADAIANRATVDAARKRPPSPGDGQGKPGQQGGGDQASSGAKADPSDGKNPNRQQDDAASQEASTTSPGCHVPTSCWQARAIRAA